MLQLYLLFVWGGGQMYKYSQIQTTIPVEAYFH